MPAFLENYLQVLATNSPVPAHIIPMAHILSEKRGFKVINSYLLSAKLHHGGSTS